MRIKRECWVENHIGMVPLTKGIVAMVDEDRLPEVAQFNWCCGTGGYPVRANNKILQKLHQFLYPEFNESVVDHVNRNPLDNRACNIRVTDLAGNNLNRKHYGKSSRYRGVYANRDKWIAQITLNGRSKHLGRFETEEMAYEAYKSEVIKMHGDNASIYLQEE